MLLHYSALPLGPIRSVKQKLEPDSKPKGLWITVEGEDDWRAWCEGEGFNLGSLAIRHEVTLATDARVLKLSGSVDIDLFHKEYSAQPSWATRAPALRTRYIDWRAVADKFQGIIIAPYCWNRRLDGEAHHWYYGWDCASGCIWDASAIASVATVEPAESQAA